MRKLFIRIFGLAASIWTVFVFAWKLLSEWQTMIWVPETVRSTLDFLTNPEYAAIFIVCCLLAMIFLIFYHDKIDKSAVRIPQSAGINIISAQYGAGPEMPDVTDGVRKQLKDTGGTVVWAKTPM